MFDLGTVFKWHNFPDIRDPSSTPKTRWFIYLGRSSPFLVPVILYLCTTTGKISEYESGACRSKHLSIRFRAGECGFAEDCILDIDINYYDDFDEALIKTYLADIEVVSVLPEDILRRIYNRLILPARGIPMVEKIDIHGSFNQAGIVGLKLPK